MKKILASLLTVCLIVGAVVSLNLLSPKVQAENGGLINISQGKTVYSPNSIGDPVANLVDGTMAKWCPNDFQTAPEVANCFAVIQLGETAVTASSFPSLLCRND